MTPTAALIEHHRSNIRKAAQSGDMERAGLYARIVVGLRIVLGDVPVRLKAGKLAKTYDWEKPHGKAKAR